MDGAALGADVPTPGQHVRERVELGAPSRPQSSAGGQGRVGIGDRRPRRAGAAHPAEVAGDQPDDRPRVLGRHEPDLCGFEVLVGRRHPLLCGREIHPQLHAVEESASLQQILRRHLAVDDAGARRHPLRGPVGDDPAPAVGVTVADLPVHHVGHGFEPAVGMVGRSLGLAGRVFHRSHVVEHQERIGEAEVDAGGRSPHLEPLAFEERRRVDDVDDGACWLAVGRIDAGKDRGVGGHQCGHRGASVRSVPRGTAGRAVRIPVRRSLTSAGLERLRRSARCRSGPRRGSRGCRPR